METGGKWLGGWGNQAAVLWALGAFLLLHVCVQLALQVVDFSLCHFGPSVMQLGPVHQRRTCASQHAMALACATLRTPTHTPVALANELI